MKQQTTTIRDFFTTAKTKKRGTPSSTASSLETPPSTSTVQYLETFLTPPSCTNHHSLLTTPPTATSTKRIKNNEYSTPPSSSKRQKQISNRRNISLSSSTSQEPNNSNKNQSRIQDNNIYFIETCVSTTPHHLKIQSKKKKDQYYLDLGQSNFGSRTICPICNMLYVDGLEEDKERHAKVCHEYAHGVLYGNFKKERLHKNIDGQKIIEIRPSSDPPSHLKKIQQVKSIVDQELGSSTYSNWKNDQTVYLYICQKRIVGYCSVEHIKQAYQLLESTNKGNEEKNQLYRSNTPLKAMMGIHQIWCHSKHRKSKIATQLVDTARSKLIFGMTIPVDEIAFSSPTLAGIKFARSYTQTNTPLVYSYTTKS